MTAEQRRKAEREIETREAQRRFGARIPSAILAEMEGTDEEEMMRALRRKKMGFGTSRMTDEQIRESEAFIDKEDVKGKLMDWLSQPHAARFIRSLFQKFIKGYREDQNEEIYENRIVEMSKANRQSLEINYPVLSKTSDELLKISLNKFWGGSPNSVGNYCIVGHNYSNGSLFGKLSGADIGDTFTLTTMDGNTLTYTVYDIYVVEPTDLSCTSQRTNGNTEITLITCYNNGAQRLIIKARA
jgi:LPXTG-site transpeptidase (sortase) family protein